MLCHHGSERPVLVSSHLGEPGLNVRSDTSRGMWQVTYLIETAKVIQNTLNQRLLTITKKSVERENGGMAAR
jgi:hypothetical protein